MGATSLERVWREKFGVWCFSWVLDALDKNGKESGVILLGMNIILFGFEINLIFECKLTP